MESGEKGLFEINKYLSVATLIILAVIFGGAPIGAVETYTKAMFVDGLNQGGFILITLRNPRDGSERRICTLESGLLGAIHIQDHIDFDEIGRKRTEQIALNRWDQPFTFTNAKAFNTVKASYTQAELEDVKAQLAKYDRSALSKPLNNPHGAIHDIYTHPYRESYRDAVAHVLLEDGILVGVDDRTPLLRPLKEAIEQGE